MEIFFGFNHFVENCMFFILCNHLTCNIVKSFLRKNRKKPYNQTIYNLVSMFYCLTFLRKNRKLMMSYLRDFPVEMSHQISN